MPGRRVWSAADLRRIEIEPGDAAISAYDKDERYFVVGTLPDEHLEVVPVEQLDRKTNNWSDFSDILNAVNSGRLVTYRWPRADLLPMPTALLDDDE